ncbi:MAG: Holliday junction branch migration protein RuvA [Candidatus Nealsonbacteria bacterium]|nr:Holliday junction branch migration protein RuvA [Candidatus Nealsonbacteria bacterium]
MIYHLRGKIEFKGEKFLVMDVAGIGYKVFCSPQTLRSVSVGQEIKIFTHLHSKEDAIELYGFLTQEALGLFETLNEISGIGPKTAMMLSLLGSLEKLKETMERGSLPPEIKGIGQKKMQKILLELTGKIKELKKTFEPADEGALDALISLGFPKQKAKEALLKIQGELTQEEKIKKALRILGGKG